LPLEQQISYIAAGSNHSAAITCINVWSKYLKIELIFVTKYIYKKIIMCRGWPIGGLGK
jgi:hypothetical protein